MIRRGFLLVLIASYCLLVTCADPSAFQKSSASEEISVSEDDFITESPGDPGNPLNSTPWGDFLNDFITPFDEITPTTHIDLELPIDIDDSDTFNTTDIQETEKLPHSKLFSTLLNLEEDYKMSFDEMAKIFAEENIENNLEKKRRRKERTDQTVDIYADLEDDLVESELIKQEVKYKSLGIEPLALIAIPERRTRGPVRDTTTTIDPWNMDNEKTSYYLTSDNEMDKTPHVVKYKSAKPQQERIVTNATHEAAFLKSPENTIYLLPPLVVELTEDSTLLMNANERQEIPFEVTNNLNNAARVTFTVRDELGILLEIDRYIAVLGPHASTIVRVAVLPKSGQSTDRITFIATGSEQVRKEVLVDIESNYRTDRDFPIMDYTYTSDCRDVVVSKCEEGTWTMKITAKDTGSGLKLLTTFPRGIYFPMSYTAGTREEVTGIYSESCCNADVRIIAIDRMNNRYTRPLNAYRAPLTFWAIVAITSVSLIFLTIIIASSIMCLRKCKKNEADSFDLPTYRGGRSRY